MVQWWRECYCPLIHFTMLRNYIKPGASSMIGLFQENGPCRINNQSTGVDLNPTSWNEFANVYVSIISDFI